MCLVTQSCLSLCDPMDFSPLGSSVHGDSPGKNTEMGCHPLLQQHPKFNTANQQISSGKDITFERHQYFSAVTKLLFMLMRQLDLYMCVHNLFLTTDVIIKAVQDF